MADIVVINKVDSATPEELETVRSNVKSVRPQARIVEAASEIKVEDENLIRGKRVLAVEDGPTVTHGGMNEGAAAVAARRFGAKELVDPKPYAVGSIKTTYEKYPHLGKVLPAMGYGERQIRELKETIQRIDFDTLLIGTPIDLRRVMDISKPAVRVRYEVRELTKPTLEELLRTLPIKVAQKSG